MASGGGTQQNGDVPAPQPERTFARDFSVRLYTGEGAKVKAVDIIKAVVLCAGPGSIMACVPKPGSGFEITLADRDSVRTIGPDLKVGENFFRCTEIVQKDVVVSFLHLPAYVSDSQIENKLQDLGVELIGEIKRRTYPGTEVADGTRHVKVKFPDELKSLPYSMKFYDGDSFAYYRVIHNNQVKVCNNCLSDQHVFKNCPENRCFKCDLFGHLSRHCETEECLDCHKFGEKCRCNFRFAESHFCEGCKRDSTHCHCDDKCKTCGLWGCDCDQDLSGGRELIGNTAPSTSGDQAIVCEECGSMICDCTPLGARGGTEHLGEQSNSNTGGEQGHDLPMKRDDGELTGDGALEMDSGVGDRVQDEHEGEVDDHLDNEASDDDFLVNETVEDDVDMRFSQSDTVLQDDFPVVSSGQSSRQKRRMKTKFIPNVNVKRPGQLNNKSKKLKNK